MNNWWCLFIVIFVGFEWCLYSINKLYFDGKPGVQRKSEPEKGKASWVSLD
jgi:hypothetical protein